MDGLLKFLKDRNIPVGLAMSVPILILVEIILGLVFHFSGGVSFGKFIGLQCVFVGPALLIGGALAAVMFYFAPRGIRITAIRELGSFFNSPIAFVCVFVFIIAAQSLAFQLGGFIEIGDASLDRPFFQFHPWIWMIIAPAIGMRLWTEEHRQGTMELVATMPIAIWHAILGKFAASCVVIFAALLCTWPAVVTMEILGDPDWGPMWTGFLASFLLAVTFLGVTSAVSAFTRSQVVAFLVSVLLCVSLMMVGFPPVADFLGVIIPGGDAFANHFGVLQHFQEMAKGVISIWDLGYFLLISAVCLFITAVKLRGQGGTSGNESWVSAAGLGIIAGAGLVFYIALTFLPMRFDLTEYKVYTLSDGTREIVKRLDTPVTISYYVTDSSSEMEPEERTFARRVQDLLAEYNKLSGMVSFKKIYTEPDTNEEDAAILANLQAIRSMSGNPIYFGISVSCLDKKEPITFDNPVLEMRTDRLQRLEYELSNAILRVYRDSKPKVTVMTSMGIAGTGSPFMGGRPPWFIYQQLGFDMDVEVIPTSASSVDDDTDMLVVLHPYDITETGEYAIDQYLLGGGNVVVAVDPNFFFSRALQPQQQQNPFGGPPPGQGPQPSSDLPTLFEAWGVEFNMNQVLADSKYATQTGSGPILTMLDLTAEAINQDTNVTEQLQSLAFLNPGGFAVDAPDDVTVTPYLTSSPKNQYVNSFEADPTQPDAIRRVAQEFAPSGKPQFLAVRMDSESFKTAFPDGDPNSADDSSDSETEDAEEGDEAEEEKEEELEKDESLKSSEEPGSLVLVADVDFLFDQWVADERGRQRGQNLSFFQNLIGDMTGDSALNSIRARVSNRRPFTLLNELEAAAREAQMAKRQELEESRQKFAEELTKVIQGQMEEQNDSGFVIIDPNMVDREKREELQAAERKAARALRDLDKELKREVDVRVFWIKLLNIVPMALVVILIGLTSYMFRRVRTQAR